MAGPRSLIFWVVSYIKAANMDVVRRNPANVSPRSRALSPRRLINQQKKTYRHKETNYVHYDRQAS